MSNPSVEQDPDRRLEIVGSYSPVRPAPEPPIEDELERAGRLVSEAERAGADDLELAMRLGDVVRICFARQAWAAAVPPLTRLLALNRAEGHDRAEVATVLSSLGTAHYALGEHNEAARLWEEALQIRERSLVPNHFMIARSAENLADGRAAQGRMDEALALLRRALAIWQQTLRPSDPTVRAIRAKIGDLQLLASQELPARVPSSFHPSAAPPLDDLRDAPRYDAPQHDAPPSEEPPSHAPQSDAPQSDAPLSEEPRASAPERPLLSRSWLELSRSVPLSDPAPPREVAIAESPLEAPIPHTEGWVAPLAGRREPHRSRAVVLATVVVGLVLLGGYRMAGGDSLRPRTTAASPKGVPSQTSRAERPSPSAVAPPRVVRQASAGTVATPIEPTEAASIAREAPAGALRGQALASGAGAARAPRAAVAGDVALKPVPVSVTAQLASTMRAVESTTVVGSDSAVRRMLYGRALGLSNETALASAKRGETAASASPRAALEDPHDMKAAMLAPGGVQPVFPFQLLSENVKGNVVIELLVEADGRPDVSSARVVRSSHPLFTAAVMRVLPSMRFVPAEAHGQKVAQRIEVPFRFDRKAAGQ